MFPSAWCQTPIIEVLPLKSLAQQVTYLPRRARVHVTHSPRKTCEVTVVAAAGLKRSRPDLTVVPHLAARRIRGGAHLAELMAAMEDADVHDAFVIAGDATDSPAGDYVDSLGLIRDIRDAYPDFGQIAIPGYPDGHPFLSRAALADALALKAPWVDAVSTQICFDPQAIAGWLQTLADHGIALPVHLGVPGPLKYSRLLRIGTQIGVGTSLRFLRRHGGFLTGRYSPDALLRDLARLLGGTNLDIAGLHINTFNQVQASEDWRQRQLSGHQWG